MIESQYINGILEGSLRIECQRIDFINRGEVRFSGPGSIEYTREPNQINISSYCAGDSQAIMTEAIRSSQPGLLVPEEELYHIQAFSLDGRYWWSENCHVDYELGEAADFFIARSSVGYVESVSHENYSFDKEVGTLIFDDKLKLPRNAVSHTVTRRGKWKSSGSTMDRCSVKSGDCDLEFAFEEQVTRLQYKCDAATEPGLIVNRIEEAIEFFSGQVSSIVFRSIHCRYFQIDFIKTYRGVRGRAIQPPLKFDYSTRGEEWSLFSTYLRWIRLDRVRPWSRLGTINRDIFNARISSLDAAMLAFSVAIERLLNREEFRSLYRIPPATRKKIEALFQNISSAQGPIEMRVVQIVKGQLLSIRAIDRLYVLERRGRVSAGLADRWKKLRNPAAHGAPVDSLSQEKIDSVDALTALYYQIVFNIISYRGPMSNYAKRGWPTEAFRPKGVRKGQARGGANKGTFAK